MAAQPSNASPEERVGVQFHGPLHGAVPIPIAEAAARLGAGVGEPVVFLQFQSPHTKPDAILQDFICCRACKNKTYKLVEDLGPQEYPMLVCAACDADIGRMGWAYDDEEEPPYQG